MTRIVGNLTCAHNAARAWATCAAANALLRKSMPEGALGDAQADVQARLRKRVKRVKRVKKKNVPD